MQCSDAIHYIDIWIDSNDDLLLSEDELIYNLNNWYSPLQDDSLLLWVRYDRQYVDDWSVVESGGTSVLYSVVGDVNFNVKKFSVSSVTYKGVKSRIGVIEE